MDALGASMVTMFGRSGYGKSTLAAAMLNAIIDAAESEDRDARRRARGIRFVAAVELAEARSQHALGEDEAPLVADALDASVLVLDDFGKEPARKRDAVVEVLQLRYARGQQTIITTELRPETVKRLYEGTTEGEYLVRRLYEAPAVAFDVERIGAGRPQ